MLSRKQLFNSIISLCILTTFSFSEECKLQQVVGLDPVGDIGGKLIFTKYKYIYECNITYETQGRCLKEENSTQILDSNDKQIINVNSIDEQFQGSIGALASMMGVSNQLQFLFSGWKGYCEDGIKQDFSWLQDPYMWASFAMTYGFSSQSGLVSDLTKESLKYVKCAAAAGLDTAKAIDDYYNNDPLGCDPVDEICGEEENAADETTYTLTRTQYQDMINQYTDLANYTEILRDDGDVLLIRIKPVQIDTTDMDFDAAQAAMQKAKRMMLILNSVLTTASLAICLASDGGMATTSSGSTSSSPTSIMNIASLALSGAPLDPLTKIGLQLAMNFATSFTPINSCGDYEDAKEAGNRHQATYEAKENKMCHYINTECVQKDPAGITCMLKAQHYCCYDSELSRILTEQLKAQLGRGWVHCTDISLKELQNTSLRQCTNEEMVSAPNGVTLPYNATTEERMQSFQYRYKCIDLTEYKEIVAKQVGENLGTDEIMDSLNGLGDK